MPIARNPNDPNEFIALTDAINFIPGKYGTIASSGLFVEDGIESIIVEININNGVLNVIPAKERGSEPTLQKTGDNLKKYFKLLHYPLSDRVSAADVQNRFFYDQFSRKTTDRVIQKINDKLELMRKNFAITKEKYLLGALQGILKNNDGTTLINVFDEFGLVKKTVTFDFSNSSFKIRNACKEITRHIKKKLNGEVMSSVQVYCHSDFMDALSEHPETEKLFLNYKEGAEKRISTGEIDKGFFFGGIFFKEYSDSIGDEELIEEKKGYAHPIGTQFKTFRLFYGPPVLNGLLFSNTFGKEMYVAKKQDDWNTAIELRAESNPFALVTRPATIVELDMQ
jgi:hypothetical protein